MKKKKEVYNTSARLPKLDGQFLLTLGMKISPGCEYSVRAFRLMYSATIPELKNIFTLWEFKALLGVQEYIDENTLLQAEAESYIASITSIFQSTQLSEQHNIDTNILFEKIRTLTSAQVFCLQEILFSFLRKKELPEQFKTFIQPLIFQP